LRRDLAAQGPVQEDGYTPSIDGMRSTAGAMDQPFDSAWLKWGRAIVHVHALESEMAQLAANPKRNELTLGIGHYDPKRHGFPVEIAEVKPWPANWGVLLGDIAANFRSALDHCAWAIVHRGKGGANGFPLTKREAKQIYFPIVSTDARQLNGEISTKLIGARRADIAIVRRVQPYHRGTRHGRHPLFVLNQLCNSDKHRAIEPVRMIASSGGYQFLARRDCVPTTDRRRPRLRIVPMEIGAEVGVVRVRKTGPEPDVDVDTHIGVRPGVVERTPLDEWLAKTARMVRAESVLSMSASLPTS
jgi:hypothetical protein